MSSIILGVSATGQLSPEEVAKLSSYLSETREALIESVTGLTPSQWEFKPGSGCWSIGEIVEHLVLVESRLQDRIRGIGDAPAPPPDWSQSAIDEQILPSVLDRSKKFSAPDVVRPTQHWTETEALGRYTEARARTIDLISLPGLRGHVLPHPVRGLWDGYQWLMAAGAHSARHTAQIDEVKADPGFPRSH